MWLHEDLVLFFLLFFVLLFHHVLVLVPWFEAIGVFPLLVLVVKSIRSSHNPVAWFLLLYMMIFDFFVTIMFCCIFLLCIICHKVF